MTNKALLILSILYCVSFANIHADETTRLLSLDVGNSDGSINIFRLGIQKKFTVWPGEKGLNIPGYFESSLFYWKGNNNEIYGVAFSPVFIFQLCDYCKYDPYIEGGIGISFLSDTKINNRDLSSSFQFEDRIGFGIKVNNIDYHIRYMHYSNGSLKLPNPGVDMFVAGVAFKF